MARLAALLLIAAAVAACSSAAAPSACLLGESRCVGDKVAVCGNDGTFRPPVACPGGAPCDPAELCGPTECRPGDRRCSSLQGRQSCSVLGRWVETETFCDPGFNCDQGRCAEVICAPQAVSCVDNATVGTCNDTGTAVARAPCAADEKCRDARCVPRLECEPGTAVCRGLWIARCADTGESYLAPVACPDGGVCRNGACAAVCAEGSIVCRDGFSFRRCTGGVPGQAEPCPGGRTCDDARGGCVPGACVPGRTAICDDGATIRRCAADGAAFAAPEPCPAGTRCIDAGRGAARCDTKVCEPGSTTCADGGLVRVCDAAGGGYGPPTVCEVGVCDPEVGGCRSLVCVPDARGCDGPGLVRTCNGLGTGFVGAVLETCPEADGGACVGGRCLSACERAEARFSYLGCAYAPIQLPNGAGGDDEFGRGYAIVVSNPDPAVAARVQLQRPTGNPAPADEEFVVGDVCPGDQPTNCTPNTRLADVSVPPGGLVILRPRNVVPLAPDGRGFYTMRLTSNLPVAAYQFNPLDNSGSGGRAPYSIDASLLLPVHTWQNEYVGLTYHEVSRVAGGSRDGRVSSDLTITAGARPVRLRMTPPRWTALRGLPAADTDGSVVVALDPWESINLTAAFPNLELSHRADLTSTYIRCDAAGPCAPFAVFGGHPCVDIPMGQAYCDHIEEQLFPTAVWGREVVLVPVRPLTGDAGYGPNADLVRVLALYDGTSIEYLPKPPASTARTALNAREYTQFPIREPVTIRASGPILVAQYMTGATTRSARCNLCNRYAPQPSCDGEFYTRSCLGDPAMLLAAPTEQFRGDYVFLTPGTFRENVMNIVAPLGAAVELNGELIGPEQLTPLGGDWGAVRRRLGKEFKAHRLIVRTPGIKAGISVSGYDQDVSYAYPGGLDLTVIQSR